MLRLKSSASRGERPAIHRMRDRGDLLHPTASQLARTKKLESGQLDEELALLSARSPTHGVRKALRTLVPVYIDGVDFSQLHYFHRLDGFQFFPVEKTVYMNVHSFVTSLEAQFPQVSQVALTYCGHLVWSTIAPHHTRLILRFIRYHEMVGEQRVDAKAGAGARDGGEGNAAASGLVRLHVDCARGLGEGRDIGG